MNGEEDLTRFPSAEIGLFHKCNVRPRTHPPLTVLIPGGFEGRKRQKWKEVVLIPLF